METRPHCETPGCQRPVYCKRMCRPHYERTRKHGHPGAAQIALPRGRAGRAVEGDRAECAGCGQVKPSGDFYARASGKRRQPCKECVRAQRKQWRGENPELLRERMVGYRLWFHYKVTREEYAELLAAQGGGCGICGSPAVPGKKRLHVDHDHETGAVRGILCHQCNTSLGLAGEDIALLERMAAYLEAAA